MAYIGRVPTAVPLTKFRFRQIIIKNVDNIGNFIRKFDALATKLFQQQIQIIF